MKNNYALRFLPIAIFLASCNNSEVSKLNEKPETLPKREETNITKSNADSIELTQLVRSAYKWHQANQIGTNFPLVGKSPNDTLFTGINWKVYDRDAEVMKKTNFFAQEFLNRHKAIALTIDSSVKKASVEWRNFNDGIPLWSTNFDDWCGCQDYPDNYWNRLKINQLKISDNTATFNWAWGKEDEIEPPFKYNMRAKKENGVWKISYMDGFSQYGTVAYYDGLMSPQKQ